RDGRAREERRQRGTENGAAHRGDAGVCEMLHRLRLLVVVMRASALLKPKIAARAGLPTAPSGARLRMRANSRASASLIVGRTAVARLFERDKDLLFRDRPGMACPPPARSRQNGRPPMIPARSILRWQGGETHYAEWSVSQLCQET